MSSDRFWQVGHELSCTVQTCSPRGFWRDRRVIIIEYGSGKAPSPYLVRCQHTGKTRWVMAADLRTIGEVEQEVKSDD